MLYDLVRFALVGITSVNVVPYPAPPPATFTTTLEGRWAGSLSLRASSLIPVKRAS